jgi:N-acetylglucosamine kinase-like BadF-type ATPase
MSRVQVTHTIGELARDVRAVAVTAQSKFARTVRASAAEGNRVAKGIARESAGAHGKHYHKAFTAEAVTPLMWEYGPDASRPQGGMSFEHGSRNQPPHLDLNKSADVVGPKFADGISDDLDSLFWP